MPERALFWHYPHYGNQGGAPAAVISTPFAPIPQALFGVAGKDHLDATGFAELVETNLTHHFRVARKVSLGRE